MFPCSFCILGPHHSSPRAWIPAARDSALAWALTLAPEYWYAHVWGRLGVPGNEYSPGVAFNQWQIGVNVQILELLMLLGWLTLKHIFNTASQNSPVRTESQLCTITCRIQHACWLRYLASLFSAGLLYQCFLKSPLRQSTFKTLSQGSMSGEFLIEKPSVWLCPHLQITK